MTAVTVRNGLTVLSAGRGRWRWRVHIQPLSVKCLTLNAFRVSPRRFITRAERDMQAFRQRATGYAANMADMFVNALASNAGSCALTEAANVRATA